ncbi:bifunctional diaminohydroxyphosphoribosylaminopyrimidine deaminase/5-amino-6-(5-phosphoribosylamino)uracil reductase RibD [Clostridium perfringens]|uniref:bifunctional diaminohydroxyphosphoribosylaminopyrimidine deaminase/5-amino-6-(5-phosphoribosylamino)uracil reductase RibD n=1 Tax=Clostridium perfringens TaxID=1502 RepID=UPI000706046F|nr:bifunctional diaminohydroxyphosphoribosylaminopyrimidine deaminase/5-amino-6-(5-phosphoribosylamino)uracil reductase RibD [Clostridium perfringens]ALG47940.1 Diaminohydroxyphosphoribosylaminopyrimidine deaminase / 5-amino-6-(5-phosphoribosylamino)uracil reductase [Clostridium perfringens]MDH2458965.1 bifunctional diaminohydroxyphosphoribosylaminopyrimidine deaminase/5-amino-6-(5-phosphoribosylamino)uracil reductase RibD [Clostridium perfringens]MDM0935388.1 bifunctional diaminohydroxyphosphor
MDEFFMKKALELARKGEGYVNPNPLVGAVIVKDGEIIGQGYHEFFGGNHAEINAINSSIKSTEGATIYVTLEPCCHYGKTPPCIEAIIKNKFKRVVVGTLDPNPLVSGKSIKILRESGIEVKVGVLEKECIRLNEIFNFYIKENRPFIALKWAMTLDGKIATKEFKSKWITNKKSREFVHSLRNKYSSIMVGINTVLKDNPDLRCRLNKNKELERKHFRIVLDSKLRIPLDSEILKNQNESKTLIFTTNKKDKIKNEKLKDIGIEVIEVNLDEGKININQVLECLKEKNIDSVLIEGGGNLNFTFLENKKVNKIYAFVAPKVFGGKNAITPVEGEGIRNVLDAFEFPEVNLKNFDKDILIECGLS